MKHFSTAHWADFVRGLLNKEDRKAMQEHAVSDCRKCRQTRDLLESVWQVCRAEGRFEVPAYAVRFARAIYALQRPERVQFLPKVLARLVYDSFREPQLAGVRARQRLARQALYEAGEFSLDLRLESSPDARRISLVGQIASRQDPNRALANVPILLLAAREVVASAVSNEFGEFHMGYSPRTHLRLYVPVNDGKSIQVALSGISGSRSNGANETTRAKRSRKTKRKR